MADIGARRTAEPLHCRRLKRQQGEHMVNVPSPRARAARTPCPDRGADIIDYRNRRRAGAHAPCHTMREVRTVDDDKRIRLGCDDRMGGFTNAGKNLRQAGWDGGKADDGKIAKRKQTRYALRGHLGSADAGKSHLWIPASEGADQRSTQAIPRIFASHQKKMRPRSAAHCSLPAGKPITKKPAKSVVVTTPSGSAIIVEPATTAMPARRARATPSMVFGPIEGRSKRRSCPGFGAFTITPLPAGARTRPLGRIFAPPRKTLVCAFGRLNRQHMFASDHD